MPLTNAERQRMYRLRRDSSPTRRAAYLQKKKVKYEDDLTKGKRKKAADMTKRELREQRKEWRHRQQQCRRSRELVAERASASPSNDDESVPVVSSTVCTTPSSTRGRRRVQRNRSALYRENLSLRQEVLKHMKTADKFKKRYSRLAQRQSKTCDSSPRKAAQSMLHRKNYGEIRKALVFHHVLISQLREKYKHADSLKKKESIASAVSGKMIKKYRLLSLLHKNIGMAQHVARQKCSSPQKVKRRSKHSDEIMCQKVISFYEQDDVSRVCPGVKQAISRNRLKKQKRLLTDDLRNLHKKFVSGGDKISYSLFCRLRPFWVVPAQERDRETCLCVLHENVQYLVKAMTIAGLVSCTNLDFLVTKFMCNADSEVCAYGDCSKCSRQQFNFERPIDDCGTVSFFQWESTKKTYTKDGATKEVKVTSKTRKTVTESEAVEKFFAMMGTFKRHWFTYLKQARLFRECKSKLKANECVIHVDFSENYNCKYHAEVQSVHFGASHQQASLHTVVIHTADSEPLCLCTVSASLDHGPTGIWAHLKPVLQYVCESFPQVKHVNFWSDGPTAQYKQKKNFARICGDPFKFGFQSVSWNYFESAHGKGAVDGVGATVKRLADFAARHGKDVNTPQKMFDVVMKAVKSIKMFFIKDEEFEDSARQIKTDLQSVRGTLQIHQVNSVEPGVIHHRKLSCFCKWHSGGIRLCSCYKPQRVVYSKQECTEAALTGAVERAGTETTKEQAIPVRLAGVKKNVRLKLKRNKLSKKMEKKSVTRAVRPSQVPMKRPLSPSRRPPLPRRPVWLLSKEG